MANKGAYGQVEPGLFNNQRIMEKTSQEKYDHSIELEIAALSRISQYNIPHIVELKSIKEYHDYNSLILERVEGDTLAAFFQRQVTFDPSDTVVRINQLLKDDYWSKINLVFRTLLIVDMMYELTGITHDDLHPGNVLVRETKQDIAIYTYKGRHHVFKTYGYEPVIIDFGMAYVPETKTMLKSSKLVQIGILPYVPDSLMDSWRLLYYTTIIMKYSKYSATLTATLDRLIGTLPLDGPFLNKTLQVNMFTEMAMSMMMARFNAYFSDDILESLMCKIPIPFAGNHRIELTKDERSDVKTSKSVNRELSVCYGSLLDAWGDLPYDSLPITVKYIQCRPYEWICQHGCRMTLKRYTAIRYQICRLILCLSNEMYNRYRPKQLQVVEKVYRNYPKSVYDVYRQLDTERDIVVNVGDSLGLYNFKSDKYNVIESLTKADIKSLLGSVGPKSSNVDWITNVSDIVSPKILQSAQEKIASETQQTALIMAHDARLAVAKLAEAKERADRAVAEANAAVLLAEKAVTNETLLNIDRENKQRRQQRVINMKEKNTAVPMDISIQRQRTNNISSRQHRSVVPMSISYGKKSNLHKRMMCSYMDISE